MKYIATLTNGGTVELELSADSGEWITADWLSRVGRQWLSDGAALVNLDHVMSIVPADRAQPPGEAPEVHRDADGNEWTKRPDGSYETPTADGRTVIHTLDEVKRIYGMGGQRAGVSYADHPWRA